MTTFFIKRIAGVSNPAPKCRVKDFLMAVDSVYSDDGRFWEINFCNIPINLCMSCIGDIYADIVEIEKNVRIGKKIQASFLSPQIACVFEIDPRGEHLLVDSWWTSASDNKFLNELRELAQPSKFDSNKFLSEITKFLQSVRDDLTTVGYGNFFNASRPWGIKQN